MGWSFAYVDIGRKAHINNITSKAHFSEDFTPLQSRIVGNHIWQLVRQESTGRTFIALDLIAKERNGGWGYKGLSEDMGPYYYDCPMSLVNAASEPMNESAKEWRQKVRDYHAAKKMTAILRKPVPGLIVKSGSREYKLIEKLAPRKGWKVMDVECGAYYRMPARQLSMAQLRAQGSHT